MLRIADLHQLVRAKLRTIRCDGAATLGRNGAATLGRALWVLTAAILATACASGARTASREPAVRPAETFDAAWTIVRDEHFDASLNGVDWNAVRDELRPRAARAQSADELRGVLNEMLARLGQSHFTIIPAAEADASPSIATASDQGRMPAPALPPAAKSAAPTDDSGLDGALARGASVPARGASVPARGASTTTSSAADAAASVTAPSAIGGPGIAGLDVALIEGEPTVLRVSPGLPAARAGVLVGWRLVSVDGLRVADLLHPIRAALAAEGDPDSPHARQLRGTLGLMASELLSGDAGTTRTAVFADASGSEQRIAITFEPAPLGATKFGNLPAFPIEVDSRIVEVPLEGMKPVRIGVISFNIWMTGASDAIDRAVDSMRNCDGIVLDLRGNPGGMGAMSMGVAGHFLREPASLGSMLGRDNALEFRAEPRKVSAAGKRVRPYASKPLAILVDGRSASTSEVFAGGLQDLGRARVFGEVSAGMALPAQAKELPNGDVLLHAVADFVTPKGTRLEGRGVIPDEAVAPTREALLRGDDAVLAAASKWIRTSTLAARAAKSMPSVTPGTSPESALIPNSMPSQMPAAMPPAAADQPK
jgi:carboxyl-terminal processing protease